MLETEKPDIAVISPRFDLIASVCTDCARLGIHIIAEKPLALEIDELNMLKEEISKASNQNNDLMLF